MRDFDLLRHESDAAFAALQDSVKGLTEPHSWGELRCRPGEYLHTEGSILSVIAHIASCKFMFASAAFCDLELRWTDTIRTMDAFWPSLDGALKWLDDGHSYWQESWSRETDFERPVMTNWGEAMPAWNLIWMVAHHDSYHAGQIQMLRSVVEPSDVPPAPEGDAWLQYASEYSR